MKYFGTGYLRRVCFSSGVWPVCLHGNGWVHLEGDTCNNSMGWFGLVKGLVALATSKQEHQENINYENKINSKPHHKLQV